MNGKNKSVCILLTEAIADEEKAISMYRELTDVINKSHHSEKEFILTTVETIMTDESKHHHKLDQIRSLIKECKG